MIRDILEEPASIKIWSDPLLKEYGRWKKKEEDEKKNRVKKVTAAPPPAKA